MLSVSVVQSETIQWLFLLVTAGLYQVPFRVALLWYVLTTSIIMMIIFYYFTAGNDISNTTTCYLFPKNSAGYSYLYFPLCFHSNLPSNIDYIMISYIIFTATVVSTC